MKQSIQLGLASIASCVMVTVCALHPKYYQYETLAAAFQGVFAIGAMVVLVMEIRQGKWDI